MELAERLNIRYATRLGLLRITCDTVVPKVRVVVSVVVGPPNRAMENRPAVVSSPRTTFVGRM